MRVIRPSATTRLTAVSSSPASSIRPAGAPFSDTVPTTASGAIVLKRERRLATRSRPTTGRRKAATSPPPSATSTTSGASTSSSTCRSPLRTRRLVGSCSDLGVGHLEDLAQDEDRPFGGRKGLQHGQHRDRDALSQLDVLGHVGRGGQRLGQPLPDVLLAPPRQGPEPVERLPGDDPDQVGPRVPHLGALDVGPPQPGLLDHVLGVGGRAEHLVGDGEEQAAVGDERVVGHVVDATASGLRSQAAEWPWDSMPNAVLVRVYRFASAMNAVSSTSAGAPSWSSSRADNSSVTVGGVSDIASAYSMTSRSSGVKTSDSRHRGTSRALVSSRPSLCAWK